MDVIPVEAGPIATIGYMAIDKETGVAAVIDVPLESAEIFQKLSEKYNSKIRSIFLTHSHWDHTGDTALLKKMTNSKVYIHKADEYRLTNPNENTIFDLGFKLESANPDYYFEHNSIINIGNIEFEVRHTPGHTEGGVCLVVHKEKVVFAGDTIFYLSIGRTDFPGGSYRELIKSIKEQIMTLDDDYKIFSGHGQSTSVGYERANNPFLNGYGLD